MLIDDFFHYLIYTSFSSSLVILAIIIIRNIFNRKHEARWNYYIWFILIAKLVIPYFPQGSVNIYRLLRRSLNIINNNIGAKALYNHSAEISTLVDSTKDYTVSVNNGILNSSYSMLYIIWLMVFILCFIVIVVNNIRLKLEINKKTQIQSGDIKFLFENCKRELNIKRSIGIVRIDENRYPALLGFVNPSILIPDRMEEKISYDDMRYILLHELAHYKRKDIIITWIITILQLIYWFNPLIYYAFYLMKKDMEVACDSYVLSRIDEGEIKSYGFTIVKLLELRVESKRAVATLGIIKSKESAKNRIRMVAGFKKDSKIKILANILVFSVLAFILLSSTQENVFGQEKNGMGNTIKYEDLSTYYKGFDGSFVLLDVNKGEYTIYNKNKSEKRISPCSTYKVVDALIGLETGAIKDEKEIFKWDGSEYPYAEWNQDQTLFSAIQYSVNWYFELVDKKIDRDSLNYYINNIAYGNKDVYSLQNNYWLQASLKISPIEQVQLLKKMNNYELPFSKKNIDIVKKSIKLIENEDTVLYGKTGSGVENNNSVNGWFVGFIENGNNAYIFASNIEATDGATGTKAKDIALKVLKEKQNIIK